MTATQMANAFLAKINQANNTQFFSFTISYWLNVAQNQLFNFLYYPEEQKRVMGDSPRISFEDSQWTTDALAPFTRVATLTTSPFGFLQKPSGLAHLTALGVYTDPACQDITSIVPAQIVRADEIYAVFADPFDTPTFVPGGGSNLLSHNIKYYPEIITSTNPQTEGWRLFPKRQYTCEARYVIFPPAIAVQNFAWETVYAGNPQYQVVAADINSLFPDFMHEEIVIRAVAEYNRSSPDYQQAQIEAGKVASGQM